MSGQQSIRPVDRKSITNEILANENFAQQRFEEGTFITSLVRGLPGYRAEVTARESAQSLEQNMTVFGLIGKNLEHGALDAVVAGAETVAINITSDELTKIMGPEWAERFADPTSPTGLKLPILTTGNFSVSGISALMRDMEIIRNIREVILPLFEGQSIFLPYLKPYKLLKSLEKRMGLQDEGIMVDQVMADAIDGAQQRQQEASIGQALEGAPGEEVPPELAGMLPGMEEGEAAPVMPAEQGEVV